MDLDSRYQRDVAALTEARGIMMNKSFFLMFFLCALFSALGLLIVAISGVPGWVLVAVLGLIGGAGVASGKMDSLMLWGLMLIAAASGVASAIVAVMVFAGAH
jgi:hypothetical protein